ncbi:MAG: hypothetical protein LBD52_00075 [Prevotellaceae bacterium]|nr:hypothetical protein [Prevotellaceae bacterium]
MCDCGKTSSLALLCDRHPVRDATFVELVRMPDGMRGLIFRVFLSGGNP